MHEVDGCVLYHLDLRQIHDIKTQAPLIPKHSGAMKYYFLRPFSRARISFFIFDCTRSLLLHMGFLWLRGAGATLHCDAQASHYGSFSPCGAQALGTWAQ